MESGTGIIDWTGNEDALQALAWRPAPEAAADGGQLSTPAETVTPHGDLEVLSRSGPILDAVGPALLRSIASDSVSLLGTSCAILEKNGDYAAGIFASSWCRFIDFASRQLRDAPANREGAPSDPRHCYGSCFTREARRSIEAGEPLDAPCLGGIRLFSVPIRAGTDIIGSITCGYGDPPQDTATLRQLATVYGVSFEELREHAKAYASRSPSIIELAKKRLLLAARLIGEIVQRNRAEQALRDSMHALGERDKQLSCLQAFSRILDDSDVASPETLQRLASIIPLAWRNSDVTCARILLEGSAFHTANFKETPWKQASPLVVDATPVGAIEVCYLAERPPHDEGPFLKEERGLLDALAGRLAAAIHARRERDSLRHALRAASSETEALKGQLETDRLILRAEAQPGRHYDHILGQSAGLRYVLYRAEKVAPTNATVLILGETGVGKELIAGAIHGMSSRRDRPMITVNCAALPAHLIESELFGREKGAFTGADTRQMGRFEAAEGSTLCLDEIGELPLDAQAKLLRVLQHREFERLGSSRTIKVDVRILATTNRNLEEEVRKGRFRQDLYYRLNVFSITVPPLRQRKEDISLLVEAFIARFSRELGKEITSIRKEAMESLQEHPWPGNVRELESVIHRAVILSPGPVLELADHLEIPPPRAQSGLRTLQEIEREQIIYTLSKTGWRINGEKGAAAIVGLHPSTLRARMQKLGIKRGATE